MNHLFNLEPLAMHSSRIVLASALLASITTLEAHAQQVIGGATFSSTACASEWGTCSFTGSRTVAYGANGRFNVRTLSGPAACNNSTFGDPYPGVAKSCFLNVTVAAPTTGTQTISGQTFSSSACASEWSTCSYTGTRTVAYGAAGRYSLRTLTGPVACNNGTFGDPIPGTAKSCFLNGKFSKIMSPCLIKIMGCPRIKRFSLLNRLNFVRIKCKHVITTIPRKACKAPETGMA